MIPLYYNMVCKVNIGTISLDYVNSISIEDSIKLLENKATIILPREYLESTSDGKPTPFAGRNILEFIKVDDPVSIWLGYDDDLQLEFEGYVKRIGADIPLQIDCEDEMHFLRKTNHTAVLKEATLEQLVKMIAPDYSYDLIDNVKLGKFTIDNESAYKVLSRLRKNYGLHARFKDKVLEVGFPISFKPQKVHEIIINRNVRALSNDLKFVRKEDFKLLLKAIAINKDGKRIHESYGDSGGAQRTLHFTDKSKAELKDLAEKNFKSLNFDGYQGSIPTWGNPRTKSGESVDITDPNYENSEHDGKYLIEGVNIKFNSNDGFKRVNKLGLQL
ncbi:MAG: hypothetical protein PSN34_06280 [Urechidicola sp.]|nr:hypothetical protein [Urechidicola sp.]